MLPEAGGSSSFARRAFNEFVSFGAGWALMLDYIVTIAISAFFVPNYLAVFWPVLKTWPYNSIGGIVVILALVVINVIGIKEAARLNIVLAVARPRHPGADHGHRRPAALRAAPAHRPGATSGRRPPCASSSTPSRSAPSRTPASRPSRTWRRRRRTQIATCRVPSTWCWSPSSSCTSACRSSRSPPCRWAATSFASILGQATSRRSRSSRARSRARTCSSAIPLETAYLPVETVGSRTLMPAAETKPTGDVYTRDGVEYTTDVRHSAGQQLHRGPGAGGGALHPRQTWPGCAASWGSGSASSRRRSS